MTNPIFLKATTDNRAAKVLDLLAETGPGQWREIVQKLKANGEFNDVIAQDIQRACDVLATTFAMLSEYAGMRGGHGTFDHGHEDAMREAVKTKTKVRKALSYHE